MILHHLLNATWFLSLASFFLESECSITALIWWRLSDTRGYCRSKNKHSHFPCPQEWPQVRPFELSKAMTTACNLTPQATTTRQAKDLNQGCCRHLANVQVYDMTGRGLFKGLLPFIEQSMSVDEEFKYILFNTSKYNFNSEGDIKRALNDLLLILLCFCFKLYGMWKKVLNPNYFAFLH